jgi:hypothetical protein
MLTRSFLLFAVLGTMSCGRPMLFPEPQPADVKNLNAIPKRLYGTYVNLSELDTLVISEKAMLLMDASSEKGHRTEADSAYVVSGNVATNRKTGEQHYCVQSGDSVTIYYYLNDTIFSFNREDVLRKHKGYFFLNRYYPMSETDYSSGWGVQSMYLKRGKVVLNWIGTHDDIEKLMRVTESSTDTISHNLISPTKKQFTEFILNDGFSDGEVFVKVK